jgi:hypothetical protein
MTVDQSLKLEVHHLFLQGLVRWQAGRQAGRQTDRHNTDRLTGYIANQFLSFSSQYDDESSTSAPPLPIKGSKVSMQRQPIPLPKQPHRSKETSSSPSSPTIPPKPSFRTDGPQISPSVASSIAQIAAQAHRSAKNRQQALQPPSKPPLARKPNIQLTVSKWLADAGVPQHYADYLIQSGWDDPSFFNVISDNDLESVGITNREHRQRILEKARQR